MSCIIVIVIFIIINIIIKLDLGGQVVSLRSQSFSIETLKTRNIAIAIDGQLTIKNLS